MTGSTFVGWLRLMELVSTLQSMMDKSDWGALSISGDAERRCKRSVSLSGVDVRNDGRDGFFRWLCIIAETMF